jgi:hypothetical protein
MAIREPVQRQQWTNAETLVRERSVCSYDEPSIFEMSSEFTAAVVVGFYVAEEQRDKLEKRERERENLS